MTAHAQDLSAYATLAELIDDGYLPEEMPVRLFRGCIRVIREHHAADESARTVDADGHMIVAESRISKANVCEYYGREIPNFSAHGLDPDKVYQLWRHPDELQAAASTFDAAPLLERHKAVTDETPSKDLWIGAVGKVTFEAPYLVARPIRVVLAHAQTLIETGKQRELSSGYRYTPDMTPGVTPQGEPYDGVMRDIQGNHVAIVKEGRAGPDVHVADSKPEDPKMAYDEDHREDFASDDEGLRGHLQSAMDALEAGEEPHEHVKAAYDCLGLGERGEDEEAEERETEDEDDDEDMRNTVDSRRGARDRALAADKALKAARARYERTPTMHSALAMDTAQKQWNRAVQRLEDAEQNARVDLRKLFGTAR